MSGHGGITCDDVRRVAYDYRRGELDETLAEQVDAHLAECDACDDHFARLTGMIEGVREVERDQPEPNRDDLFVAILAAARAEDEVAEVASEPERRAAPGPEEWFG
jgi:anti-sigma factor RsiW